MIERTGSFGKDESTKLCAWGVCVGGVCVCGGVWGALSQIRKLGATKLCGRVGIVSN